MRQKENYVAPELTVVEFKVERGYSASTEIVDDPVAQALGGIVFGEGQGTELSMGSSITNLGNAGGSGNPFAYVEDGSGSGGAGYFSNGSLF